MRKRFKIKNLIRNKFQRNIFLNDALASGSAMVSENIPLKHILLSKGEGGHSPLLHSGYPLQPNMLCSVIPQQFRCIPEGVGALRYLYWGTFNATGFV